MSDRGNELYKQYLHVEELIKDAEMHIQALLVYRDKIVKDWEEESKKKMR